jgi:hypothetical protein
MKNLTTCLIFALFAILTSCDKVVIMDPIEGTAPKVNPINWTFTSASALGDAGYYSIQTSYGLNHWQYTRITQMNVTGLVMMDNQPVRFSGDFYIKQVAGYNASSSGYLHLCEARDNNINHCLDFVISNKTPIAEGKALSDLKGRQIFEIVLRLNDKTGRYDKPENNSRELELKLITEPAIASYTLNLTGGMVY